MWTMVLRPLRSSNTNPSFCHVFNARCVVVRGILTAAEKDEISSTYPSARAKYKAVIACITRQPSGSSGHVCATSLIKRSAFFADTSFLDDTNDAFRSVQSSAGLLDIHLSADKLHTSSCKISVMLSLSSRTIMSELGLRFRSYVKPNKRKKNKIALKERGIFNLASRIHLFKHTQSWLQAFDLGQE